MENIYRDKRCIVCGNTVLKIFSRHDPFSYLQCLLCGHIVSTAFWSGNPQLIHQEDNEDHHLSKQKLRWDYSLLKQKMIFFPRLKNIESYKPGKGRLLDIGCANGAFCIAALKRKWEVHGLELQQSCARFVQKKGMTVYTEPIERSCLPESYFDVITLWQVLEHIPDPLRFLNEIVRILKPGGICALSTPNNHSIGALLLQKHWPSVLPRNHYHLFSKSSLRITFLKAGFRLRCIETRDLHIATLKKLIQSIFKSPHNATGLNATARFISNNSYAKNSLLLHILNTANIVLSCSGLGEDFYMYAQKAR